MAKLNNSLRGKIRKETEKAKVSSGGREYRGYSNGATDWTSTAFKTQYQLGIEDYKNGRVFPSGCHPHRVQGWEKAKREDIAFAKALPVGNKYRERFNQKALAA